MTKLHKAKLISDAKYEKLQLQIDLAENNLNKLKEDYAKLEVKAPFDGTITNFHISLQEPVRIGTKLFTIIGEKSKIIRCIAPQAQAYGLKQGQKVNIKSKLKHYLKYRVYEGFLKSVSPYGAQEGEAVHYELIIEITDGQEELPVGSTALCEIIKGKEPLIYIFIKNKMEK
jgi:multidrug resistance efflux pump